MKKRYIAMLMLLVLLLTACTASPLETQPPTEPTPAPATEPATEPPTTPPTTGETKPVYADLPFPEGESMEDAEPVSGEEVGELMELFTRGVTEKPGEGGAEINWYNKLLNCHYRIASQIDLQQLFSSGCEDGGEITQEEKEFLSTQSGIDMEKTVYRIPAETIKEVLKEYADWDKELQKFAYANMVYYPENDVYFCNPPESQPEYITDLKFIDGFSKYGMLVINYQCKGNQLHQMNLYKDVQSGTYSVYRNFCPELERPVIEYTQAEIDAAIQTVKDEFSFPGCTLTDVWFDQGHSDWHIATYMTGGNGKDNGVSIDDVILILSNFQVGEDANCPEFEPGSSRSNFEWILIRDGKDGAWRIDDQGY